jgi:hypothetical protein
MINESALCKLISVNNIRNVVNLGDDGFQYSNGYFVAVCNYNHSKVISKLYAAGALKGKRGMEAKQTCDLSEFLKPQNEIPAIKTDFLMQTGDCIGYIFKINDTYYVYNKSFIDVFGYAAYKARVMDAKGVLLMAYDGDELIGAVMNTRIRSMATLIAEIQEIELQIKKPRQKQATKENTQAQYNK